MKKYIFYAHCRAGAGLVAAISGYLAQSGCYIHSLEQFDDDYTQKFFFRSVFSLPNNGRTAIDDLQQGFYPIAHQFDLTFKVYDPDAPVKAIIMVSKFDHCLHDLLYRLSSGDLFMDLVAVVSNHETLRPLVESHGVRFEYMPVTSETKAEQEDKLLELITATHCELVVLARYMQILSAKVSKILEGRCINIHHSFLPSFKGARPYHQAYERGVKFIGATAHYVNTDLDEGPIIEQIITRVDHNSRPDALERLGRDNESIALARAVKYYLERRIFLDDKKTIVFLGGHY